MTKKRYVDCNAVSWYSIGSLTRGLNGPDIAHLDILPQLVKIHLVVIEILSISCSVLIKADGDHLALSNCKYKIKMASCKGNCNKKLAQFNLKIFSSFILCYFQ